MFNRVIALTKNDDGHREVPVTQQMDFLNYSTNLW
jgi:hypothetical protein